MPQSDEARMIRVNAALKLERWQDAIPELERLLHVKSKLVQPKQAKLSRILALCWLRIGNVLNKQGNVESAADAYRKALSADPASHDACYNLGLLELERGRSAEAIELLQQVVDASPADTDASLKLAAALIATGHHANATSLLSRVAAQPALHEHLQRCCELLLEAGSGDAAKTLAGRLLDAQPETAAWIRKFCRQLRECGDLAGSRQLLGMLREQARDPVERQRIDLADALGLPSTYEDLSKLQATRRDYLDRLHGLVAAYPPARVAGIEAPPEALLWDNFYLAYQGENDCAPQSAFGSWLSRSLTAVLPELAMRPSALQKSKPRIAMVSSRLHECTVGSHFASWIEHLGNSELILVHIGSVRDHLTERLANIAHGELTLDGSIAKNAEKLRDVGADLLLYPELGMDYRTLVLAALRLSPRRVCAWGHPVTTGLPTWTHSCRARKWSPTMPGITTANVC